MSLARLGSAASLLLLTALGQMGCSAQPAEATVEVQGLPASLDPHLQDDSVSHSALFNVFEALVAFDADMRVQPALAERWENRDEATWRFVLRDGVRFHDGRLLSAQDVVRSLERARSHPHSQTAPYLVAARGFRALDRRTLEIQTLSPYPLFLNKLAFVAVLPGDTPDALQQPVGTGPYRVASFDRQRLRLQAFGEHWAGAPALPRVALEYLPDRAERVRRLLDGHASALVGLPFDMTARVARAPGCRLERRRSLTVAYLGLRSDRPPFADPRVREALDVALDRQALVAAMAKGSGEPTGQIVGREVFGYAPDIVVPLPDPKRARELLRQAGYPDGFDVDLHLREGLDASSLVAALAAVGVRTRTLALGWNALMSKLERGEVALYLGGLMCPSGDASDVLDAELHSANSQDGYGSGNFSGYANAELDELIERAGRLPSMPARLPALQQALRLVAREHAVLPLYVQLNTYGVRDSLAWRPRLDGFFRAAEAAPR